jgi:hypothetical protein
MNRLTMSLGVGAVLALAGLTMQTAQAQARRMAGEELIRALQAGGYVLVMNQADAAVPTATAGRGGRGFGGGRGDRGGGGRGGFGSGDRGRADGAQDDGGPRPPELTTDSRNMLIGVRHAIWHFQIPIDHVYTSPTRAAAQQAEEVPFADIMQVDELAEDSANSGWLAAKLGEMPMAGSNAIIVTHAANIADDLGMSNVDEGETLVVKPGENPAVVGRIGLKEWSVLSVDLDP